MLSPLIVLQLAEIVKILVHLFADKMKTILKKCHSNEWETDEKVGKDSVVDPRVMGKIGWA